MHIFKILAGYYASAAPLYGKSAHAYASAKGLRPCRLCHVLDSVQQDLCGGPEVIHHVIFLVLQGLNLCRAEPMDSRVQRTGCGRRIFLMAQVKSAAARF